MANNVVAFRQQNRPAKPGKDPKRQQLQQALGATLAEHAVALHKLIEIYLKN